MYHVEHRLAKIIAFLLPCPKGNTYSWFFCQQKQKVCGKVPKSLSSFSPCGPFIERAIPPSATKGLASIRKSLRLQVAREMTTAKEFRRESSLAKVSALPSYTLTLFILVLRAISLRKFARLRRASSRTTSRDDCKIASTSPGNPAPLPRSRRRVSEGMRRETARESRMCLRIMVSGSVWEIRLVTLDQRAISFR